MKRIISITIASIVLASCQHMIAFDVTYDVSLDKSNTYVAGEPVRFNISGDVDNLVFYSGEPGHQFEYKNRFEVPLSSMTGVDMEIQYQPRWGAANGLDVYVSNTFAGLKGNDGAADRATIQQMIDGGMQGWTKLDYNDGAAQTWESHHYDIASLTDNFSLAFHWHPTYTGTSAQRTYWLNGIINLQFPGAESQLTLKDLDFVSVLMNEQLDPYLHAGNGSIIIGGYSAEINFQGCGGTEKDFALDGWCISNPMPLNKVDNDKGEVIKDLENYMTSYEYTYTEPGSYKAVFMGVNENVAGRSQKNKTININIL